MTIANGRVSIFTFPRFLGFGRIVALHWPTRIYANFVAKNPRAYVGSMARTLAFWGGGYIEPWAYPACIRSGGRPALQRQRLARYVDN
jgi:hypothetical protein